MIEETARVVAVEGRLAWVETGRAGACNACAQGAGCGILSLAGLFGRRRPSFRVANPIDARVGDEVIVGVEEAALVNGSLLVYLLPLLLLIGLAGVGDVVGKHMALQYAEGLSIVGGLGGMALGFAGIHRYGRRVLRSGRYQPIIVRFAHRVVPFRHTKEMI
jgi:sigma-E factor negative regulatory protein RseC